MARDRVKPLKLESTDTGGDEDDEFPTSMDPQEDSVECRGIVFDDETHIDENVVIERNGDALDKITKIEESRLLGNDQSAYSLVQNSDDEDCFIVYGDKSARFCGPLTQGDSDSLASGVASFAQGANSQADADASHAQGIASRATNDSQHAWAGGCFVEPGDAQASHFVLRGTTPGVASGEEIELHFRQSGDAVLGLPPRAWCILLECVASSGDDRMCFKQMLLAKSSIGPPFRAQFWVSAFGMQEQLYTEGAKTWTLRVAPISFPVHQTRMGVLFCSGVSEAVINVVCNIRMIETSEPEV